MISKIFPHPILVVVLWVTWLLLNNSVSPGHMVLGLVVAVSLALLTSGFWPEKVAIKSPLTLVKFFGVVMWDIVVANTTVAKLILGKNADLKPAFFYVDIDLDTPLGISILTNTISLTPGTVACDLTPDHKRLLVHALHVEDIPKTIKAIKQRYEAPLKKVFVSC